MAKELSKQEEESLNLLEKNMDSRLQDYEKEMQTKSKAELQTELNNLNDYLEGCRKSEIDDTRSNILFCEKKAHVLQMLISED